MRNSTRKKELKNLSYKFDMALDIFARKFGNNKVVYEFINTKIQPNISTPVFSKMKLAHERPQYLKQVSELVYRKVFEIIDPILETDYHIIWTSEERIYKEQTEKTSDPRLNGLIGTWECYSWDAVTTKMKQQGHMHLFKMKINTITDIHCITRDTEVKGNRILIIGSDRASIELSNERRKIYIIFHIGNGTLNDLKRENSFNLAYIDSGDKKIRSGLAIIERTEKNFDDIKPASILANELESDKPPGFFDLLKHSQLILD